MNFSVGIVEFTMISKGYVFLDYILKNFAVKILKTQKICPGRFMVIFSGNTDDVQTIITELKNKNKNIITASINNISEHICKILSSSSKNNNSNYDCIVIAELKHSAHCIKLADTIYKKFAVNILKIQYTIGMFGKGLIIFSGNTSNLDSALKYIEENTSSNDLVSVEIIRNPSIEFNQLIN